MSTRIRALAFTVGVLLVGVVVAVSRSGQPEVSPLAEPPDVQLGDSPAQDKVTRENPFGSGEEEPLAEAERDTGFTAPMPDHPKANESILDRVFSEVFPNEEGSRTARGAVNQMALQFSSGVMIIIVPYSTLSSLDPADYFKRLSAELNGAASVETVAGVPAMLISPTKSHIGSLSHVREGLKISIYGPFGDATLEELKEIAESLSFR